MLAPTLRARLVVNAGSGFNRHHSRHDSRPMRSRPNTGPWETFAAWDTLLPYLCRHDRAVAAGVCRRWRDAVPLLGAFHPALPCARTAALCACRSDRLGRLQALGLPPNREMMQEACRAGKPHMLRFLHSHEALRARQMPWNANYITINAHMLCVMVRERGRSLRCGHAACTVFLLRNTTSPNVRRDVEIEE